MPNRAPLLLMTSSACVALDDDAAIDAEAVTAGGGSGGVTGGNMSCESEAGFCATVLDQEFAGCADTTTVVDEVVGAAAVACAASARRATGAVAPIVSDTSASTAMSDADCRRGC